MVFRIFCAQSFVAQNLCCWRILSRYGPCGFIGSLWHITAGQSEEWQDVRRLWWENGVWSRVGRRGARGSGENARRSGRSWKETDIRKSPICSWMCGSFRRDGFTGAISCTGIPWSLSGINRVWMDGPFPGFGSMAGGRKGKGRKGHFGGLFSWRGGSKGVHREVLVSAYASFLFRYSPGVQPWSFLKARTKFSGFSYPTCSAMA